MCRVSYLFSVLFMIAPAGAAIVYEGFDYGTGTLAGLNGGDGFSGTGGGAWVESSSGNPNITVLSTSLGVGSLPTSGNRAGRTSNANRAQMNRAISNASRDALTADNTTMWFSVIWSPGAAGTGSRSAFMFGNGAFGTSSGDPKTGADGFGFSPFTGSQTSTVHAAGWVSGDASDNPNTTANTGITHAANESYLFAGRIDWKPNGTPDEFYLFRITDPSAAEPGVGTALASITTLDFDQSAWNRIAVFENHAGDWDEIRFDTTFAGVMGIPEPSSLLLGGLGGLLLLRRRR